MAEKQVLRWIAERSPTGRAFHVDAPQIMFGVDLGMTMVSLACRGLCGIEDPDLCWSTDAGRAAGEGR